MLQTRIQKALSQGVVSMGKGEPTDEKVKIILTQSEKERVTCMLISRTGCPEQKSPIHKANVKNIGKFRATLHLCWRAMHLSKICIQRPDHDRHSGSQNTLTGVPSSLARSGQMSLDTRIFVFPGHSVPIFIISYPCAWREIAPNTSRYPSLKSDQ